MKTKNFIKRAVMTIMTIVYTVVIFGGAAFAFYIQIGRTFNLY